MEQNLLGIAMKLAGCKAATGGKLTKAIGHRGLDPRQVVEGQHMRALCCNHQIADEARATGAGWLSYDFGAPYDFGDVAFSHGDGVVRGVFVGRVDDRGTMLRITGETTFEFIDIFEDQLDVGIEAGGTPYPITGNWTARFVAEVMKDAGRSEYGGGVE
ncbi:hypothetical protein [Pontitalea aquivivens]|uniref:hypothetical protein n=1 Tax=Pontitalea aquivivens TaxID=3388663 RepID=UPI0039705127